MSTVGVSRTRSCFIEQIKLIDSQILAVSLFDIGSEHFFNQHNTVHMHETAFKCAEFF